ncbi:hypothetical protein L6R53_13670 [Myxococcota bacterium]|nr:hypothetical protein [Myxococcota bacterium]
MARRAHLDAVDLRLLALAGASVLGLPVEDLVDVAGLPASVVRPRVVHLRRLGLVLPSKVRLGAHASRIHAEDWPFWRLPAVLDAIHLVRFIQDGGEADADELARRAAAEGWHTAVAGNGRPSGTFLRALDEAIDSGWLTGPSDVLVSLTGIERVQADPAARAVLVARQHELADLLQATTAWLSTTAAAR